MCNQRQIHYTSLTGIDFYIGNEILLCEEVFSRTIIELLLEYLFDNGVKNKGDKDLYDFIERIFKYIFLITYDAGNIEPEAEKYKIQENRFWSIWKQLNEKIISSEKSLLLKTLFFKMDNDKLNLEKPFKALNNNTRFFEKMIPEHSGKGIAQWLIEINSSFGRNYLPSGLSSITEALKKENKNPLKSLAAERLVKIIFYNHISAIKNDKKLIDDFIWMLNQMVDLGSSEAYMFRENVITYRNIQ